jgi:gas vesicle protein
MSKGTRNLLIGVVIGASAGFIAGVMLFNTKNKKADKLKSKITNLAADAQERINALRAMAARHEEKKAEKTN